MIRYRNEIFEDYFIDPETAVITDKNGNIQKTKVYHGRTYWKCREVYRIQIHTHFGYIPKMSIHHKDNNKLNDSLSNLTYVTNKEHGLIHGNEERQTYERTPEIREKISKSVKNLMTDDYKKKISELTKAAMTEEVKEKIRQSRLGKKASEETREKLRNMWKNNPNPRFSTAGFSWWNNGYENKFCKECPEGFVKGRLKKRPNK